MSETGKTKDAGYQAGVRKTFAITAQETWEFLFSKEGLKIWLGDFNPAELTIERPITTALCDLKLTTFRQGSHLRMQWRKKQWTNTSILQMRIIPSGQKTTISFHQEKLADIAQRQEMIEHWQSVLSELNYRFRENNLFTN